MLHVDGLPYRILAGWVAVIYSGFLWIVGSLLVVTAPAATFALFGAVRRVASGDGPVTLRTFMRDMTVHFWPASRVGAIVVAGWAVVVLTVTSPLPPGILGMLAPFVAVPVFVMWALTNVWVFSILEQRRSGAYDAFRVAYLRALRRPMHAIAAGGTSGLILTLPFLVPSTIALPFWLSAAGGSALAITAFTMMAAPASSRHTSMTPHDLTAAADSAVKPAKEAPR